MTNLRTTTADPAATHDPRDAATPTPPERAPRGALSTALWLLLVVCLVGNTASSVVGVPMAVTLGISAATAACLAALVALHLRGRR